MAESARIYCRSRCVFPWEPQKRSVKIKSDKVLENATRRGNNSYTFTHVFDEECTNEDLFNRICTPLIDNVVDGQNAVLIAYGQTGSGKTHSLVGKPEQDIQGLLPRTLHKLMEVPSVTSVELLACEAYGVHVARLDIFDLFGKAAAPPDWSEKKGRGTYSILKAERRKLSEKKDSDDLIQEAHDASHFAPTAKNPESSRGHTVFVIKCVQESEDGMDSKSSYFVVADLAGSEGESAITKQFVQNNNPTTVMVRRLEGGCINAGLCQLQLIFAELRRRGKLSLVVGNGLRRLLHPFINTNTHISVLFTIAPTLANSTITESTLKFAVQAGMVKVTPVAARSKKNIKKLLKQLEETVEQQTDIISQKEALINDKNEEIEELENQVEHLNVENSRLAEMAGTDSTTVLISPRTREPAQNGDTKHRRVPTSEMSNQLFANLNDLVNEMDGQDDYETAKPVAMMSPKPKSKKKPAAILALPSLNEDEEEDAMDDDELDQMTQKMREINREKTEAEIEIDQQVLAKTKSRNSIRFEQSIISHIGLDIHPEGEDEDEKNEQTEEFEFDDGEFSGLNNSGRDEIDFETFDNDDKESLIDKIEALKTLLKEKEVVCEQYKQAQIVMMDHLAETNEALFHFFKVRYKIPGEKQERGSGIYSN